MEGTQIAVKWFVPINIASNRMRVLSAYRTSYFAWSTAWPSRTWPSRWQAVTSIPMILCLDLFWLIFLSYLLHLFEYIAVSAATSITPCSQTQSDFRPNQKVVDFIPDSTNALSSQAYCALSGDSLTPKLLAVPVWLMPPPTATSASYPLMQRTDARFEFLQASKCYTPHRDVAVVVFWCKAV